MASLVEFEPAPAITGTRPLASSTHHSTTCLCSSWLSVGLSPGVPTGTRPCEPCSICQLTRPRKAASSSEPFLNGVTKAVNEPRKFVLAAMDILPTHAGILAVLPSIGSIHIGSGDPTKASTHPSRDFAAVMAQTSPDPA